MLKVVAALKGIDALFRGARAGTHLIEPWDPMLMARRAAEDDVEDIVQKVPIWFDCCLYKQQFMHLWSTGDDDDKLCCAGGHDKLSAGFFGSHFYHHQGSICGRGPCPIS